MPLLDPQEESSWPREVQVHWLEASAREYSEQSDAGGSL